MRKFKRPMPLSGSPDVKCERLKKDVTVLVTELEEELSRMERRMVEIEKQIKGGKQT